MTQPPTKKQMLFHAVETRHTWSDLSGAALAAVPQVEDEPWGGQQPQRPKGEHEMPICDDGRMLMLSDTVGTQRGSRLCSCFPASHCVPSVS